MMTRLAVLADVHGNLPALEAVMGAIEAQGGVDQVVIAGDLVNWGPFSAEVVAWASREDWALVRGNNEYYLLDYDTPRQPESWKQFGLLPWLHEQLAGRWQRWIATWPDELSLRYPDAPPLRVFHASPGDPWLSIHPLLSDEEIRQRLAGIEESTIIAGHSHLCLDRQVDGWHIINPGTVGVPLDGRRGIASYVLLQGHKTGWEAEFRQASYDLGPLLEAFEGQRFVERYGVIAQLIVREFETGRLQVHPFNHWRPKGSHDLDVDPALRAAFDQIDKWVYTPPEYRVNLDA
jgi:predicted phosphodiesterase